MFCMNCGTKIADGLKFCINCGSPVTEVRENQAQHAQQQIVSQQPMPQPAEQPMPKPVEQPIPKPVQCPTCGMLMYSGRRNCLICDKDLSNALEPEQNKGKDEQTATE